MFVAGFLKVAKENEESSTKKTLRSLAAGGALGAAAYGMLRRKRLSKDPYWRKIQEKSKNVFVNLDPGWKADISRAKKVDPIFALKNMLDPIKHRKPTKKEFQKGMAYLDLSYNKLPDKNALNAVSRSADKKLAKFTDDKLREQRFIKGLSKKMHIPTTTTERFVRKDKEKALEAISRHHGGGYYIKERGGLKGMERGAYAGSDVGLKDRSAAAASLNKALNKRTAKKYIAQPEYDIKKEFRVHTIGGKVIPGYTFDRAYPLSDAGYSKEHKKIEHAVSKAFKGKKVPNTLYGLDVAKTNKGYKIIETNPTRWTGTSGFFEPMTTPLRKRWKLHESMTGQKSRQEAAVKALGIAGAGTAAAQAAQSKED